MSNTAAANTAGAQQPHPSTTAPTLFWPALRMILQNLPVSSLLTYVAWPGRMGVAVPSGRIGTNCSGVLMPSPPGSGQYMNVTGLSTRQMPVPKMLWGKLGMSGGSAGGCGGWVP
jgi:hypothetical protein